MDWLHGVLGTLLVLALWRNRRLTGGAVREWRAASRECRDAKRARAGKANGTTDREE